LVAAPALAAEKGEEVELASGQVTALSCAKKALETGSLDALTSCPPEEAVHGLVVYDVAEKQIYKLAPKKVRLYELEKAFAGGSIDFTGVVLEAKDKKSGVPLVEVKEYSITPRPKPGSFKGCL
jgi:hypothetical protein